MQYSLLRCLTYLLFLTHSGSLLADDKEDIFELISFGRTDAVQKLLEKNPSLVKARRRYSSETPLQAAATQHRKQIVKLLLDAGAKMDALSAAALNDVEQLEAILKKEPWQAKRPFKTLDAAVTQRNLKSVKLLLDHGADPNLDYGFSNVLGPYTPLSSAVVSKQYEMTKLLLEHGAKVDVSAGKNYDSVLKYAFTLEDKRFLKLLEEYAEKQKAP